MHAYNHAEMQLLINTIMHTYNHAQRH